MDMTLNRAAWRGVHIASHNNDTAGRVVRIQYQFWLILLGAIVCSLNLRAILEIIAMVHCRHFFASTRQEVFLYGTTLADHLEADPCFVGANEF